MVFSTALPNHPVESWTVMCLCNKYALFFNFFMTLVASIFIINLNLVQLYFYDFVLCDMCENFPSVVVGAQCTVI